MDLDKIIGFAFNIFFVVMLILIILYTLKIMSKDLDTKTKTKTKNKVKSNDLEKNSNSNSKVINTKTKAKLETKQTKVRPENIREVSKTNSNQGKFKLAVMKTMTEGKLRVGNEIPLANITTLGRKEDNSIILNDKFVSSNHAKIYVKGNEIILEDLNSTNGSFVNEQRIAGKIRIGVSDSIRLGSTVFKVIG